jgi:hypothetical protein
MNVDLSTVWHVVAIIVGAVMSYAIPVITTKAVAFLHLKAGSQAADDIDQALEHALGLVIDGVNVLAANYSTVAIKNQVLAQAADMVIKLAPAAADHLNLTTADVITLITAKLAKLTTPEATAVVAVKKVVAPTALSSVPSTTDKTGV